MQNTAKKAGSKAMRGKAKEAPVVLTIVKMGYLDQKKD